MAPNELLTDLREKSPLVHCITNYVAMNIAANVLLAAGASPAMVHAPEEQEDFAPLAGALTINIGTISSPWLAGMTKAARVAGENNIPWVLDPVAHFISAFRRDATEELMGLRPTIVRGNASEILALAGEAGSGKGVDSGDAVEAAHDGARRLAESSGAVVVVTGPVDYVTDGSREVQLKGGSDLMPKVTALGCSLTALMGGYAAVGPAFDAAVGALAHFNVAGSAAAGRADGPGSFQMHFLDALAATKPGDLEKAVVG